jgi:predicted dehydrogenase
MFIKVRKRVFKMPPPVAGEGETLVRVTTYAPIKVPPRAREHRFAFENQVAKLLFFLWREGVKLTVNKVRASYLQRAISRERQVVFAVGRLVDGNAPVVAIGPQDCPDAEIQCFPRDLVFALAPGQDAAPLHARAHDRLMAEPGRLTDLFHYSPFSGRPVGVAADTLVLGDGNEQAGDAKRGSFREVSFPAAEASSGRQAGAEKRNEVFLVGAGAYACAYILPTLSALPLHTIVDLNPALAALVSERFKFRHRDTSVPRAFERLIGAAEPIVILAGYHSTHAEHAAMAAAANPEARIFVEKPPALDMAQASRLIALREAGAHVEIGYNRRFAPMAIAARQEIAAADGPVSVTCVVKELRIPDSHWYYWPTQGTRILGNVGHWVDLGLSLVDAEPVSLVVAPAERSIAGDEISMTVLFEDGSRLTIIATKLGNGLRGVQEFIDIRRGDVTVRIDDFVSMTTERGGRRRVRRRRLRDKGHMAMYRAFIENVAAGRRPAYSDRAIMTTTRILAAAADAARRQRHGSVIDLRELAADG